MNRDVRDRLVLPFAVPVGLFVVIGVLVWSFSRILLAVERETAIAIALAAAVDIIIIATLVAGRKPDRRSYHMPLLALSAVAVIGGGVVAAGKEKPLHEPDGGAHAPAVTITAKNVVFDKTTIALPAGRENVIHFVNEDATVDHNVTIFRDAAKTDAAFRGKLIKGPESIDYHVPPLNSGTFPFHCDVHPAMQGTVEVTEGGPAPAEGHAAGTVEIEAKNVLFDLKEFSLTAGGDAVIEMKNEDAAVEHNVAIYRDEAATQEVFKGKLVRGPKSVTYTFKAPPAGTYFFRCDVHPNMKGTVNVR